MSNISGILREHGVFSLELFADLHEHFTEHNADEELIEEVEVTQDEIDAFVFFAFTMSGLDKEDLPF